MKKVVCHKFVTTYLCFLYHIPNFNLFCDKVYRGLLLIKYVIRTNTSPLSHTLFTIFFCSVIGSVIYII